MKAPVIPMKRKSLSMYPILDYEILKQLYADFSLQDLVGQIDPILSPSKPSHHNKSIHTQNQKSKYLFKKRAKSHFHKNVQYKHLNVISLSYYIFSYNYSKPYNSS